MGKLGELSDGKAETDMETLFCSVSLDIIGKAVFNYPFDSVTKESPVIKVATTCFLQTALLTEAPPCGLTGFPFYRHICLIPHPIHVSSAPCLSPSCSSLPPSLFLFLCPQAVYGVLQEAEHRSVTPFPYWNLPLASTIVPRQRKFKVPSPPFCWERNYLTPSTNRHTSRPTARERSHVTLPSVLLICLFSVSLQSDMALINRVLDELIGKAINSRSETDLTELENKNYAKVTRHIHSLPRT
jgi:hypothetical protein